MEIHTHLIFLGTWFLNDSIAGIGNLLSLGLVRVLVVVEVAINSNRVALINLIQKNNVNKREVRQNINAVFVLYASQPSQY